MKESNIMNKQKQAAEQDFGTLAEDARALMAATADVAGEKVGQARQRVVTALDNSRQLYGRVRDQAAERLKAADQTVRERPYQAMAIALGVGALIGYLAARRRERGRDRDRERERDYG